MLDLTSITTVTPSTVPPKIVIFGTGGVGKTTLASEFPDPVFVPTEDGTIALDGVASFPVITAFEDFLSALRSLAKGGHGYRTVVIDSISMLEYLVQAATCHRCGWSSIEDPGYGKGYVEALTEWKVVLTAINYLRDNCGMLPVMLAHDEVRTTANPISRDYDRYQMRLNRKAEQFIRENIDILAFMTQDLIIATEKTGMAETNKARGNGQRLLKLAPRPAFTAKCRYRGVPDEIEVNLDQGWQALAEAIPAIAAHGRRESTTKGK